MVVRLIAVNNIFVKITFPVINTYRFIGVRLALKEVVSISGTLNDSGKYPFAVRPHFLNESNPFGMGSRVNSFGHIRSIWLFSTLQTFQGRQGRFFDRSAYWSSFLYVNALQ